MFCSQVVKVGRVFKLVDERHSGGKPQLFLTAPRNRTVHGLAYPRM